MYIDETIQIDVESLPKIIQEDIALMEQYYKEGDWGHFDMQQDAMTLSAKTYYHNGRIDLATYRALTTRYQ